MLTTRVAKALPATAAGRTFVLMALVDSVGTGLYLAGSAVFFIRVIGLSTSEVGWGLAVASGAGFLAAVPLGALADRVGAKTTLIGLQVWRAAWFIALAFAHGAVSFTLISVCLTIAQSAVSPATQAVASAAVGDADRVRTMATMRSVRNAGFAIGALLTSPILATDNVWAYRSVVLVDAVSFVGAAILLGRLTMARSAKAKHRPNPLRSLRNVADHRYLTVAGLNGLLTLHTTLLSVGLPLWVVKTASAPTAIIPVLIVINTVLAVVLQVRFARGAEEPGRALAKLRNAGLALVCCCALMGLAAHHGAVVTTVALTAGIVCLTGAEMWQAAGAWEISYRFAPEHRRVEYLSAFSLGQTGQQIWGPPLVTVFVIGTGVLGWLALAAVFVAASLLARPLVTRLREPMTS